MILANNIDSKIGIIDVETYRRAFILCCFNPDTSEWTEFEISAYKNDLYSFVKWYQECDFDYFVMFNGIAFDQQVLEWIVRTYDKWEGKSGDELAVIISQYASDVIDNSNHGIRGAYYENSFQIPQLDLFKIWHYDRDQRSTGLKKLEFSMDFETIEELPFNPMSDFLSEEQVKKVGEYCRNDVLATNEFLEYTLGNKSHNIYKGDNKIELRLTLKEEFGFDSINISDTKIGDEIIKKEYCKEAGILEKDLPKKGFFRKTIPIKYCIPKYVKFATKELKEFVEKIRRVELKGTEEFAEKLTFYGQTYDFKKGGLHNRISGKYYQSNEEMILLDLDVTGYYSRIIINNQYYPYHLKRLPFIRALSSIVNKREQLKPLVDSSRKIKGIVQGLKIASLSIFGKTSEINSWMYDRMVTMQATITGELSLLMLIEDMELSGINVVMANTDGILLYTKRENLEKIREIYRKWEEATKYQLEETEFKFIAFSTVNDYIGEKMKGDSPEKRLKVKGDFLLDSELHGDKSRRIVRLALHKYFIEGIPIEITIKSHKNIYDFCIGVKSSSNYHYELRDGKGNNISLKKMVRYFVSTEGKMLMKIKNEGCETRGAKESHCESPDRINGAYQPLVTYFNSFYPSGDYGIDYTYYLLQTQMIIDKVEGRKSKKKMKPIDIKQLNLF